ncbi:papain family cysteine protease [Cooperia oncophora]
MTCCTSCGNGCNGGRAIDAWRYFVSDGVVTGGDYGSMCGCRPYEIPPDNSWNYHSYRSSILTSTPPCQRRCQTGSGRCYEKDKYYGIDAFRVRNSETDIQREIMKNGPVTASFHVYEDFNYYFGGIYKHSAGSYIGNHAVKIIGWGKENDTPYWIIANSWGKLWGEHGYFRMIRGINDCNIEKWIYAGHVGDGRKA